MHDRDQRRVLIAGAAAVCTPPARRLPAAAPVPRAKAPGWLDMDQQALDDAYDQAVYAPNSEQVAKRRTVNSEAVRARLGFKRVAYGATPIEALDIFTTKAPNAPVMVFIHGSAWRAGSSRDNAEFAELFVNAGAHFVVLDFINVIEAGGSLFPMVDQIRRAVAWVYNNAKSFGGDPDRIYVSGRSSGSHLGGVVLITDWKALGAGRVAGACFPPAYTTSPVRLSKRFGRRHHEDGARARPSGISSINCPVVVAQHLRDAEFQRQARFAAALKAAGAPCSFSSASATIISSCRDARQSVRPARRAALSRYGPVLPGTHGRDVAVQQCAKEMSRRTLLAGAATGAAVAGIGAALAQQPAPVPRVKGPLVWLDLDQRELDDAYDQSKYAPNLAQIVKRYATNSDAVRARLGAPKRLAYGATPIEGADLYPSKRPNAPVHVFIHGGAWRSVLAKDSAFQAETFVHAGAHFVTLDFQTSPRPARSHADGRPGPPRVTWIYKNAAASAAILTVYLQALVGRTPRRRGAGDRLGKDFGLPKDGEGRLALLRDVRPRRRGCRRARAT